MPERVVTVMLCHFLLLTHFPPFCLTCCYDNHWISGDLLKPAPQIHSPGAPMHCGKMLPGDLDSSLATLVGSEFLRPFQSVRLSIPLLSFHSLS